MDREKIRKILLEKGCSQKLTEMPAIIERINELAETMQISEYDLADSIYIKNGEVILEIGEYKAKFQETLTGATYQFANRNATENIEAKIDATGMDVEAEYMHYGYDFDDTAIASFRRTTRGNIEERYNGLVYSDTTKLDKGDPILINNHVVLEIRTKPQPYGQQNWEQNKAYLETEYPLTKVFFAEKEKQRQSSQVREIEEAGEKIAVLEQKVNELQTENGKLRKMLERAMDAYKGNHKETKEDKGSSKAEERE